MPMRCPYCGSVVEPASDTSGALFCPACQNTGKVTPVWPPQPDAVLVPGERREPAPTPGKAVAALVLGLCSIFMAPLGLLLGPLAIVFGIQARSVGRAMPGAPAGTGMATAGVVLGIVGLVVSLGTALYLAADGFLPGPDAEPELVQMGFEVDAEGTGGVLRLANVSSLTPTSSWSDYQLGGTASCRLPSGDINVGDEIVCSSDGDVVLMDWADGRTVFFTPV